MGADNSSQDRTETARRASVVARCSSLSAAWRQRSSAGAAIWGGLEFFVNKQHTVGSGLNVTYLQVVMVLGTLACVLGVILSIRTARTRFDDVGAARKHVTSASPACRAGLRPAGPLMAFIILPAGAVFLANYHTFEGVHEVRGCASCHVMLPMVNDMRDPGSETLAALHYKNKYIAKDSATTATVTTASAEASRPR